MSFTVKNIIAMLLEPAQSIEPEQSLHTGVDSLKFGSPDTVVTGIVVTFMATYELIEQAISLGANLIITHEGAFYSHHEAFEQSLEEDSTYQAKKRLIVDNGIAIYRCHDAVHHYRPDWIMEGLVDKLGWHTYVTEQLVTATVIALPETMTGKQVVGHVKQQLGVAYVRTVGNLSQTEAYKRIGILVGYRGGGPVVIPLFEQYQLDLIIYGEGPEWETPEYIRDAAYLGKGQSLIVLGHAESEQPGMKLLADRLNLKLPNIPVYFLPVEPLFQIS